MRDRVDSCILESLHQLPFSYSPTCRNPELTNKRFRQPLASDDVLDLDELELRSGRVALEDVLALGLVADGATDFPAGREE